MHVMRSLARFALLLAVSASTLTCTNSSGPTTTSGALRVLFIGNSLTYTNDLPAMVQALASASGISLVTDEATEGGFALEDHWYYSSARSKVQNGNFDIVIMQQGPSSLPESRTFLREWAAIWAEEIRKRGGEPGLYAVWPEAARSDVFGDVSESYRLAAQDVSGFFFPVGDTWLEVWSRDASAELYGRDDFHPSSAGTYAAAVVIVSILADRGATTLATTLDLPGVSGSQLSESLAAIIRSAAEDVVSGVTPASAR
jgi:hypothetical protein